MLLANSIYVAAQSNINRFLLQNMKSYCCPFWQSTNCDFGWIGTSLAVSRLVKFKVQASVVPNHTIGCCLRFILYSDALLLEIILTIYWKFCDLGS